MSLQLIDGADI